VRSQNYSPLGDSAVLVNCADEASAWRFAQAIRQTDFVWLLDVVQAYTTVGIYFALERIQMRQVLVHLDRIECSATDELEPICHRIPCCYALGLDLECIARHTGLSIEQIVGLHSGTGYTIYAIGFCPGFPYLGYLDKQLSGVPRLPSPRLRLEPGSVGLTGRQTGIYTEARPGGWNIVGRTPLELVNVADGYFPLRTGDRVKFVPIQETDFRALRGKRL